MTVTARRRIVGKAPQTPAKLGELRMRRVWLAGDKTEGRGPDGKYWYVEARSREGAINDMARRTRRKPEVFDSERD